MKINWKVRVLSVKFWLALVPAILLLAQAVATPFGYKWDFANLGTQLTAEKKSEKKSGFFCY